MARALTDYVRQYLTDPQGFAARLPAPVLLWDAPQEFDPLQGRSAVTSAGPSKRGAPRPGQTYVYELKKDETKRNPFAMGITLGRVETNDLVIDDGSISRFHAWFQLDQRMRAWMLSDAESRNGSWANGLKLGPNQRTPVADQSRLRFGNVEMTFVTPLSLAARLEQEMKKALGSAQASPRST